MSLFVELKRRNVFRVAAAYLAGAWLLIQILETLLPIFGISETAARMVVIVLGIGFIPAVVLAWVFEWTPEGLKRDGEVDHDAPIEVSAAKRFDRVITAVLVLGIGYFAIDKFVLDPARDARQMEAAVEQARTDALVGAYGDNSIAVLPFDDMSQEGDQEYFSDGIAEELLNLLAQIPELRVVSRSSAFAFKGKDIHIPTVADQLNVAHILEGSVRKAGNRIRITAQLIDAASDTHLWSETFDRELDDVFAIQDEISAAVVDALRITLLGDAPQARVTSTEVLDMNLQARYYWHRRGPGDAGRARDLWERVVELDPENARALSGMTVATAELARAGLMEWEEAIEQMLEYSSRAVEADPEFAEARARYSMSLAIAGQTEESDAQYDIALQLDPDHLLILFYEATKAERRGDFEGALAFKRKILEKDPMSGISHSNTGLLLTNHGHLEEGEKELRVAIELGTSNSHSILADNLFLQGRLEEALASLNQVETDRKNQALESKILFSLGREQEAAAALEKAAEMSWSVEYAGARAWQGDIEGAFDILEANIEEVGMGTEILVRPEFEAMRSDPRWQEIVEAADLEQALANLRD